MTQHVFTKPNKPDKLMDELITQIPALAPVTPPGSVYPEAVFRLWTVGDNIYIDVNDGIPVTQEQLQAVIDAHINTPRPPTQAQIDREAVKELLGKPVLTIPELTKIVKVLAVQAGFDLPQTK